MNILGVLKKPTYKSLIISTTEKIIWSLSNVSKIIIL
jgi:hypothetical protein